MAEVIKTQDFEEKVMKSEKPVLVDFFATWCGPCKMMAPVVDEIAAENPDIAVYKVDIDESEGLAARFGIMSVPTFIAMKDGELTGKVIGAMGKQALLNLFK